MENLVLTALALRDHLAKLSISLNIIRQAQFPQR